MSTSEVLRARAFRLALAFAATITVATAAIFALIYLQVSDANVRRIAGVLEDEAAKGGADSDERLRRELDLRITRDLRHIDYVAVFDPAGNLSFGNVASMPAIPVDGLAHRVDRVRLADSSEDDDSFLFVASRRTGGGVLLLGRGLDEINAMRESVLRALGLALAPTILLVLGIGAVFARRATRRLAQIHQAITEVMAGDLNRRLPATAERDDIDRVTRDVNLMLDEICHLLDQLKSVGDNIAHDLRTPLAVARAKLERGLAHGGSIEDLRAAMTGALDHLDKSVATIAALLRISQLENGPRGPRFADIDLAAICAGVFEFYEPLAQSKSIAMTLEADGPIQARGDEDLFREAISNLVDNAVKFTPEGGRVRICATTRDGRVAVSVGDSGCGVPREERDKIFRRFYRLERSGGQSGLGLGLSIAETIARVHGFTMSVEDNAPGARFEMGGPAAPPAAGAGRTGRMARAG
jgi:signal transduction histidine kinase